MGKQFCISEPLGCLKIPYGFWNTPEDREKALVHVTRVAICQER